MLSLCGLAFVFSSLLFVFFFSSRRRHTRLQGDWSSDVCSSDLKQFKPKPRAACGLGLNCLASCSYSATGMPSSSIEIGRASCRERVYISVVAVSLKKKNVATPAERMALLKDIYRGKSLTKEVTN